MEQKYFIQIQQWEAHWRPICNIIKTLQFSFILSTLFIFQIDFENAYIGSPIIDLMYFFTSSVAFNVIGNYKNELLFIYHTKLTDILGRLKYKGYVPTLLEFQVEFLKRGILGKLFF